MKRLPLLFTGVVLPVLAAPLAAQNYAPPPSHPPDAAAMRTIAAKTEELGKALASLRTKKANDALLADVEVFHKAAVWIVRHNEFFQADAGAWTLEALDTGLERAEHLAHKKAPWLQVMGRAVVRGYRSRIDGSEQPYAVTLPVDYGENIERKWRLDLVLHGRDTGLTEVKFLHQHRGERPAPADLPYVQIDIFGRGNNAYRWAGETDVFEVARLFTQEEHELRRVQFELRPVLRGFSMGGAGTWHLGLHHPGLWSVLGPGAGFTTTHGYIPNLAAKLPPYQEACLHIYDAADYAENAFDVPVVTYSGDKDPQYQAALNIEAKLKPLHIPITHLVAPGLGHSFPPEWQKKAEAEYARHATPGKGRKLYPDHVRFVTYTMKYPDCSWVRLDRLERHYQRALVDAKRTADGFGMNTENARVLYLQLPNGVNSTQTVHIDGQELRARPWRGANGVFAVALEKRQGKWHEVLSQRLAVENLRRPWKSNRIQGPIDDAFMEPFVCVRGTGKPWNAAAQRYAEAELKRFGAEWDKFFRGELPVKDDKDLTGRDLATKHLILFGDPGSNSLIGQVLDALPLQWTRERIAFAGRSYAAAEHVPVLIYPSPVQAGRYVVLNSGHTFHAPDLRGTNAWLFPRLGDYAILKPAPTEAEPAAAEVLAAGLFDEDWQVGKQ